ncbi:MAG: molybdopterin-dependent oxidoreductase, partial [Myxococcales bacterium]|nr:molybdopterin-dependent oxidoreductase [Myxococcales bacterium]
MSKHPSEHPQIHQRSCNLCEAMCGLLIEHDGEKVLNIRGDKDDPLSTGHICPKAFALRDIYEDPDRLRTPIRRTASGWQPISWDDALDEVSERLIDVGRRFGKNSVAVYQGNPSVHNLGTILTAPDFVRSLRTKNRYSATSVDQLPHHFVSYYLFGHQHLLPVPDIDRTQHFLLLGGNPLVSNGSLMSAPNMRKRLAALKARDGQFVVIDPRKTKSAAKADAHHFIVPGRDALLLAALIHRVFAQNQLELGHLADHIHGVETLQTAVQPFAPDQVAAAVGMTTEAIEKLADDFVRADRAVCQARLGVCVAEFGALGVWFATVLNIITGNFDSAGGMMFASPAVDIVANSSRGGHDRW